MPTTTIETTQEVTIAPGLKTRLLNRLRDYAKLSTQKKQIEGRLGELKAEIGAIRDELGVNSLTLEGFTTTLVAGVSSKLDVKKLLAQGVTEAQIKAATVETPKEPYELVTIPKDSK